MDYRSFSLGCSRIRRFYTFRKLLQFGNNRKPDSASMGGYFRALRSSPAASRATLRSDCLYSYFCGALDTVPTQQSTPKPGKLFGLFLILLFGARFVIEYVKIDQVAFEEGMLLNMGQTLSIPFILVGIYLVSRKPKRISGVKK